MTLVNDIQAGKKQFDRLANGIRDRNTGRFYAFQGVQLQTGATTQVYPNRNSSLFLDSAQFSVRAVAGDTGTYAYVGVTTWAGNYTSAIRADIVPSTALNVFAVYENVGLLLKPGTAIGLSAPNITLAVVNLVYAEVDDI